MGYFRQEEDQVRFSYGILSILEEVNKLTGLSLQTVLVPACT
jgi:hypothetical protein